ncbi:hypothetical protein SAMN00120144_0069 [Hymenobacter roseosalivarius DSM 11622]|uniref:DUF4394 domain-containing protein n=1 Tax=Hymenobacter roseosalivarius DSM 11622 TaxID=645990 RepID=A0A1W1W107_9BACT|nr:DUF4394 domain-containing protein [Hymenobacter roseosalivarius]SMB99203.1 hypothetical protein SAMN00120144_0069 [Hymenobacter roseosalivarius DSM 11622]
MKIPLSLTKWGAAVLLLSSLTSCEDILEQYFPKPTPTPPTIPTFPPLGQDIAFYALSGGTRLDAYSTANPGTRSASVGITGLGSGETLLAIDFRPATGQLYGISSASRLYIINQNTGAARALGTSAFTPALGGNLVGFDFNPTVDLIRLVTSTGQNLRLNPETGTVANTDGGINGAVGATLTGVAYTNNTAGASTTALYAINTQNQQLYLVNPPNDGTVVPVGNLNLPVSGNGGFDIDARTGTALGLYTVNGNPTLFTVDLTTGAARPLAQYSASAAYSGIAIPTQPVAYAASGSNIIFIFNPETLSSVPPVEKGVRGFTRPGEQIVGLDFRPANGQLYALVRNGNVGVGSDGQVIPSHQIYTINTATGVATLVGRVSVPSNRLSGERSGFDFDPVTDRMRIITGSQENLWVSADASTTTVETRIDFGLGTGTAIAYDNNFAGAPTTRLYALGEITLFEVNPPSAGRLTAVGNFNLGQEVTSEAFDIGGTSSTGYALLIPRVPGPASPKLYRINLTTGAATLIRDLPGSAFRGLAIGLGF